MTGVYNLVSSSSTPIVSLAEAKQQTNTTDFGDDDALLTSLLDVATQHLDLENGIIGRPLLTQVWEYAAPSPPQGNGRSDPRLRGLPPATGFVIDRAPLQSVDKVEYLQDGVYQTLASGQWAKRKISKELTLCVSPRESHGRASTMTRPHGKSPCRSAMARRPISSRRRSVTRRCS